MEMDPLMTYFGVLIIFVGSVSAEIEMDFSKFPESVTAPVGDEVTFECAVRVPGETLAWRWRPVDAREDQWTSIDGTSDKDKLTSSLKVEIKSDTVNSFYQCVVWYGSISLASVPAKLTIATIDLSRNTQEKRVLIAPLHNTVVMHCREPLSEPPALISWWKETSQGKKNLETPHGVLVIHNASVEDTGTYGCTARNELSGQTFDLPEKTYLRVQHEGLGAAKFLEEEEYVGTIDNEGALTVSVLPNNPLRIWCGAVGTPSPKIMWTKQGDSRWRERHENLLVVDPFTAADEGVYTCTIASVRGQPSRRSWKVIALQPPYWEGSAASVNVSEGKTAHVACGTPMGQPTPKVHWLLNSEPLQSGKGVRTVGSDMYIEHVEKRHAGIVQCFACSPLGCVYDAALLSVVPTQITEGEYSPEQPQLNPSQIPKKKNRKNKQKKTKEMIAPSRPNVTRMSDRSVMLSWTHTNHGMTILYFKVQYREDNNTSAGQWNTAKDDIKPFIHCYEVDGLVPDRYYKFRIAAIYSNNDNKPGHSTPKFFLQRYVARAPKAPVLVQAVPISNHSVKLNWTWSNSNSGPTPEGFYVYWRAVSSAGLYAVVAVPAHARSTVLTHLEQDTQYEFKVQAYTAQAPSDFSRDIRKAKTFRTRTASFGTTTEAATNDVHESDKSDALVTVGGAAGAAALLIILAATLLLCRRAKRLHSNKEKGPVPEGAATNGYISAKVPITITANPMHAESGDGGVEMSFLHNNNCGNAGNNDDTLPHSRKNGPTPRQYV